MHTPGPDALRYLDQVVEVFDPDVGLMLPEQLAARVSLDHLSSGHDLDDPGAWWRRSLAALLRDPAAPRLRTLILADWTEQAPDPCDVDYEAGDPAPLLRRHGARLTALERLYIGPWPARTPDDGTCQGIGPALNQLSALRRLHLVGEAGWLLLPSTGHPSLRELIVHVAQPDDSDELLAALLTAPFPALTDLDLWCGEDLTDALADGSFAAGLGRLTQLRRLTLRGLVDPDVLADLRTRRPDVTHTAPPWPV